MLTAIKGLLQDRRDRQEMLSMRATMVGIQQLLFPENEKTGAIVRMKTGLHLEQHLETRLGIMGPDFLEPVTSDYHLEREGNLLDKLPPPQLDQLSAELARLAQRIPLERGDPETWEDGEDTKNVAALIALRLLSGWLRCKSIVHTSMNRKVVKEAQDHEDLYYTDIKRLLRLFRGEKAIKEEGERTEAGPEPASDGDNTVLDVLHAIQALQNKGASEEEWTFVLTQQQAKLQEAIRKRTDPVHGIKEKDRKFVILEEAISAALKEGKKPEL
jgi:hypothetical protein